MNPRKEPNNPAGKSSPAAPSRSAEKVKTSRYEWENDTIGEPPKRPGSMQARVRRWLDLAQRYFTAGWDGDDDATPSAA